MTKLFGDYEQLQFVNKDGRNRSLYRFQCIKCKKIRVARIDGIKKGINCKCGKIYTYAYDLIGKQFGKWKVLAFVGRNKSRALMYQCRCECGHIRTVIRFNLMNGKSVQCLSCNKVKLLDTTKKYGFYTILELVTPVKRRVEYKVQCDCGEIFIKRATELRSGASGNGKYGCRKCALIIHGKSHSKKYTAWSGMIRRVVNSNAKCFVRYGAIGVRVHPTWRKFENFDKDVQDPPSDLHTLDRYPDEGGDYEPGNVRWALPIDNMNNRRNSEINRHKYIWGIKKETIQAILNELNPIQIDKIAKIPGIYKLLIQCDKIPDYLKQKTINDITPIKGNKVKRIKLRKINE